MPGTIFGAFIVDYVGPKWTMIGGLLTQAVVGFIMSGVYSQSVCFFLPTVQLGLNFFLVWQTTLLPSPYVSFPQYFLIQILTLFFQVIYGLFLSFGEVGPGNCMGLLASKTSPTAVRGQFYGAAAAIGKVGAFVGTWAFPPMIDGEWIVFTFIAISSAIPFW